MNRGVWQGCNATAFSRVPRFFPFLFDKPATSLLYTDVLDHEGKRVMRTMLKRKRSELKIT
jgi:hypothetical protein